MAYQLFFIYDFAQKGWYYLDGANKSAPVSGSYFSPSSGKHFVDDQGRQLITEEIQVDLVGTISQINTWITQTNLLFEIRKSGNWRTIQGKFGLGVQMPDQPNTNLYWWSEIVDAWMDLDPSGLAQRSTGKQRVILKLTRLDRWEYSVATAPNIIFPSPGTDQNTVGYMLNHYDTTANHTNWGYIPTIANSGDIPNRTVISIKCAQGGRSLGDVLLGMGWSDLPSPNITDFIACHQETDMTAGPSCTKTGGLACASCAGGNYATFAWTAAAETLIFKTTINLNTYGNRLSNGRPYKPLIRLHAGASYSDVYFKAKVFVGPNSKTIYETDYILYQNNAPLIELPPIYIPPEKVWDSNSIEVALYAIKADSSSRTFAVDFWQFWPVDGGFRKYKGIDYIASNGQIYDDPVNDYLFWADVDLLTRRAVYVAYGPKIEIAPGKTNLISFCHLSTSGAAWVIDDQIIVTAYSYPTKRNL